MAVTWSRYVGDDTDGPAHTRLESSPMFFIHKGQCDGAFRAYGEQFYSLEDGWTQLWDDIEDVMQQLAHNMTHRFEDDPELAGGKVLYYPPARIVDLRPSAFAITPDWLVGTVRNREAGPEA